MEAYILNYRITDMEQICSDDLNKRKSRIIYAEDADEAKQKFIEAQGDVENYQIMNIIPAIRPHPITIEQMESMIRRHNTVATEVKRCLLDNNFDYLYILGKLIENASLIAYIARAMGFNVSVDKRNGEIINTALSDKGIRA